MPLTGVPDNHLSFVPNRPLTRKYFELLVHLPLIAALPDPHTAHPSAFPARIPAYRHTFLKSKSSAGANRL